jgi:DNA-binding NarL/FixJ family response regulator
MAAQGYTNQEIAQALFVTARTIDAHLSHTYTKLSINSRRQLAAALDGDGGQSLRSARPKVQATALKK